MDFQELIRIRRSIRAFKPDDLPEDVVHRVLDAARVAPSACNLQPFRFIVITDQETRHSLKAVYPRDWFWNAPVIVVACALPAEAWVRADGFNAAELDTAIAMDHVILAAAEEGLGTCWVCNFDEHKTRELLGIPPAARVLAMTPLGYPAGEPRPFARKKYSELVRKDRW